MTYIKWLLKNKKGQGMVEYALIIAIIAVALIAGLIALRGQIGDVFNTIRTALGGV